MTINDFINELAKIGVKVTKEALEKLDKYYELLVSYNEKMNLTGITKKEDVYLKHFYDSLTLVKAIDLNNVESLCDIGTGAGFPGIVLKILYPHLNITLVDSLNKRINFLNIVIEELNLKNIETKCYRIEEYGISNRELYDLVTARAVASLPVLLEYAIPLTKKDGYFVAMKGMEEDIVITKICETLNITLEEKINFLLPYENSNRTLYRFKKLENTSKRYPRRYSEIKKNPLK